MKDVLRRLIREVAELVPQLADTGEYGSLTEYTGLLNRMVAGFSELLLTERAEPNNFERILLREMLDNPLLGPFDQTVKDLEASLLESAGAS